MKNLSIKRKSIVFASIILILAAILISTINYIISMNTTVERLTISAKQTIKAWSPDLKTEDIEKLVKTQDPEIQKEMIAHFDKMSKYQPQVAQGYLFGVELANGTDTSVISAPTFIMNEFADSGLFIGSLYTQPQVIVESIQKMKKSEKQTMSVIYSDSYGTWITVLKPLFDKDGTMFAYYGIDFDASAYLLAEYNKIVIICSIFIVLILLIWGWQILFTDQKNNNRSLKHEHTNETEEAETFMNTLITEKAAALKEPPIERRAVDFQLKYSMLNKEKLNTLKEHSNHVKSAIYFISTFAKESHRMLVNLSKDKNTLLETIDHTTAATKFINRLIIEVQIATDKSVQSFQLDILLNQSKLNASIDSQIKLTEITNQTNQILKYIDEMKIILQEIDTDNLNLTSISQLTQEQIEQSEMATLISNQQSLFKKLVETSNKMHSTIHLLNKLTKNYN